MPVRIPNAGYLYTCRRGMRLPANFIGDSLVIDLAVVRKWDTCLPFNMIESHLASLKSLNALKMEWGRNDQGRHTPFTNLEFSKKLEHFGVRHFAEEYLGGHAVERRRRGIGLRWLRRIICF